MCTNCKESLLKELELKDETIIKLNGEITDLKNTIKKLRKRVSKLRKRERGLVSEIEELDIFEPEVTVGNLSDEDKCKESVCPKCGSKMEFMDLGNTTWRVCVNHSCLFRFKI